MARRRAENDGRLERLAKRFERWRAGRRRGARIPEALWSAAVKLVADLGVSRTATTLGVSYYSLKTRCEEAEQAAGSCSSSSEPLFVELPATSFASRECVIELERDDGSKMRIELKGELPDVASLAERFWSGF
jgi:hypothetical protein